MYYSFSLRDGESPSTPSGGIAPTLRDYTTSNQIQITGLLLLLNMEEYALEIQQYMASDQFANDLHVSYGNAANERFTVFNGTMVNYAANPIIPMASEGYRLLNLGGDRYRSIGWISIQILTTVFIAWKLSI